MSSINPESTSSLYPLRLGAVLRLIRLSYGDCTVKEMTRDKQAEVMNIWEMKTKVDTLSKIPISRPNWNAYENGTRLVSITNLDSVIEIIQAFLKQYSDQTPIIIINGNVINKEVISSQLKNSWTQEKILSGLMDYCDIQSAATQVLAGYFASSLLTKEADRLRLAQSTLSNWLDGRVIPFQSDFALTLVLRHRYIVKNKSSRKKQYKTIEAFRKDASAGNISFSHPGPALDVILSFCHEFTYKIDTHEMSLVFRTNEGEIRRINTPVTGVNSSKSSTITWYK